VVVFGLTVSPSSIAIWPVVRSITAGRSHPVVHTNLAGRIDRVFCDSPVTPVARSEIFYLI